MSIYMALIFDLVITVLDMRIWYRGHEFKASILTIILIFMVDMALIYILINSIDQRLVLIAFLGALMKLQESVLNQNVDKFLSTANDLGGAVSVGN